MRFSLFSFSFIDRDDSFVGYNLGNPPCPYEGEGDNWGGDGFEKIFKTRIRFKARIGFTSTRSTPPSDKFILQIL